MRKMQLLFSFLFLFAVADVCSSKQWRGILPLHSRRVDVERLLGKPTLFRGMPTYDLLEEIVSFHYSEQECRDKMNYENWNVPINTVLSISIMPKAKVRLQDLSLNLEKFKREEPTGDIGTYCYLVNEEEGLTIEIPCDPDDNIVSKYIYGSTLGDEYLRCPGYSREEEEAKRKSGRCFPHGFMVDCSSERIRSDASVKCFIDLPLDPAIHRTYKWTVTKGGAILNGENIDKVEVSLTDTTVKTITVTVEVNLDKPCYLNTASYELKVTPKKASRNHRFTRRKHKPGPATSLATGKPNTE